MVTPKPRANVSTWKAGAQRFALLGNQVWIDRLHDQNNKV